MCAQNTYLYIHNGGLIRTLYSGILYSHDIGGRAGVGGGVVYIEVYVQRSIFADTPLSPLLRASDRPSAAPSISIAANGSAGARENARYSCTAAIFFIFVSVFSFSLFFFRSNRYRLELFPLPQSSLGGLFRSRNGTRRMLGPEEAGGRAGREEGNRLKMNTRLGKLRTRVSRQYLRSRLIRLLHDLASRN